MATHSSILAWKIPLREEPGGLQSMESQKGQMDSVTKQQHVSCTAQPSKLLYPKNSKELILTIHQLCISTLQATINFHPYL